MPKKQELHYGFQTRLVLSQSQIPRSNKSSADTILTKVGNGEFSYQIKAPESIQSFYSFLSAITESSFAAFLVAAILQ